MANIKWNKAGLRKLEQEVEKGVAEANEKANAAAARYDDPANKARAYVNEMAKHGVQVDEREIRQRFEAAQD